MGYQIDYSPEKNAHGKAVPKIAALTALVMILFLLIINSFWLQGKQVLQELLLPGDASVTAAALEDLTRDLRDGKKLSIALEKFCQKIIEESGLDSD